MCNSSPDIRALLPAVAGSLRAVLLSPNGSLYAAGADVDSSLVCRLPVAGHGRLVRQRQVGLAFFDGLRLVCVLINDGLIRRVSSCVPKLDQEVWCYLHSRDIGIGRCISTGGMRSMGFGLAKVLLGLVEGFARHRVEGVLGVKYRKKYR